MCEKRTRPDLSCSHLCYLLLTALFPLPVLKNSSSAVGGVVCFRKALGFSVSALGAEVTFTCCCREQLSKRHPLLPVLLSELVVYVQPEQGNTQLEQGNTQLEQGNTQLEQGNTQLEQGYVQPQKGYTQQFYTQPEQGYIQP